MNNLDKKFAKLGVANAPGQALNKSTSDSNLIANTFYGKGVDFSHGDVNAFEPIPTSLKTYIEGFESGGEQAYTEYKGKATIRNHLAKKLSTFTSTTISGETQLIITPGTQGALFLAMGSLISAGDKIAIVAPDYFANRKIAEFFDAEIISINLDYLGNNQHAGLDLRELEIAFKSGVKLFLFSNPNNPTGVIYSPNEINTIATLANIYNVSVIVDQLYSRQIFDNRVYTHLCGEVKHPDNLITVIGPSKTESLSGFRLGVAFGTPSIIARMEKLQAIVSLRASGYSQAVLNLWFNEPKGWMDERILAHQNLRDDLMTILSSIKGVKARITEAGSYLFIEIPELNINTLDFINMLRTEAKIIVTPGTEFGSKFTHSFRINFSQDHQTATAAIKLTMELMEKYRK